MQLGLIGLPSSGKTTVFNALTGSSLPTGEMMGGRVDVHTAVVAVPDVRVEALADFYHPRKITHAQVTYADIDGLKTDIGREGLPGQLVNQLEQMDGLIHVLRAFPDDVVPHPQGSVNPARDAETMAAEFLLHDMVTVAHRLEKLREEHQRNARDRSMVEKEIALFERLDETLNNDLPLRMMSLSDEEDKLLAGYGLLSRIPLLHVLNLAEEQDVPDFEINGEVPLALRGELEMEISQLGPVEAEDFLAEYGIEDAARLRVIQASYQLLGLQSFFTVGEDEVRAWTIPCGASALEAANTIHSDLARGFIRAEVLGWKALLDLGGMPAARQVGKLRVEGKSYIVEDGDIVHIRFNI